MRNILKNSFGILIFAIALLLAACEPAKPTELKPEGLVSVEKMADVVCALHLSDAMIMHNNMNIKENKPQQLKFNVFIDNGVTREDYYKSLDYYCHHMEDLQVIYQLALEKLNSLKK
jgi:hypothetical protein